MWAFYVYLSIFVQAQTLISKFRIIDKPDQCMMRKDVRHVVPIICVDSENKTELKPDRQTGTGRFFWQILGHGN
jgi:hypothetical protein